MSDIKEPIQPDVESRAESRSPSPVSSNDEVVAHLGVKMAEATHKVFGKYSKWFLFISLGLAAYIYSLDGTTTYYYLAIALSSFGRHSLISSVQVAQAIIVAVGKPVIAKIADVKSRGVAYTFVLVFYVVGYIVIASADNTETVAGGSVIYSVGYTGLQLLTQIVIADITTLRWRGLVSALMSTPFIINAFVGSNIANDMITGGGWRWGYGMFAILVPAALSPLIVTLTWAELKAKKLGYLPNIKSEDSLYHRFIRACIKINVVGLTLLGTSVALILLPCTLAKTAKGGWNNPSMIAMLVIGVVLFPVFLFWDIRVAKFPVVPKRFITNRTVVLACLVGSFDFISFYISYNYLYSFVLIVKPWSSLHSTYFMQTQTVALTVFGISAGFAMRFVGRYKVILLIGLCIRLLGCGLMIHSRGANASDAEVVWSQLLQGIGGGFAAVASQTAAQAAVGHSDVAMVTAVVLLVTEIGGAIGGAIAGGIWTNLMPGKLSHFLPFLPQEQIGLLYGSILYAATYEHGDPIREGVIMAYDDVMKIMCIIATVFAIFPILFAIFMPNWYLGDTQNAVEGVDLAGNKIEEPRESEKDLKA